MLELIIAQKQPLAKVTHDLLMASDRGLVSTLTQHFITKTTA